MIDNIFRSIFVILFGVLVWVLAQALLPMLPVLGALLPVIGIVIACGVIYYLFLIWRGNINL